MKRTPHSVNVARLTYVVICELAGLAIALSTPAIELWVGLFGALIVAGFFIFVESLMKDFTLRGFSTATFGVAIGLICGFLLNRVGITDLVKLVTSSFQDESIGDSLVLALNVAIYSSLAFLGAVLALRSNQEDFSFIIPYVRFRQDAASGQPLLLDGEVIMDGRLPRMMAAGFLKRLLD